MRKLEEVEQAKQLMQEAEHWSVMKWLAEKKKVRKAADRANDAHAQLEKEIKAQWSAELKSAYQEAATGKNNGSDAKLLQLAKKIKDADDEAYRVRMDAEATFDKAEKILSTSLAREGTRKAIACWELRDKALLKAEAAIDN